MQTCAPLTARTWFKLRTPVNWAVCLVVFVPLMWVLLAFCNPLVATAISIGVVFCVFFFVLDKRPLGMVCPHDECGQYIETNTPWLCGNKGCRNDNADDFPFIYKCQHCGYSPKAYLCHHCSQLIFFTRDEQKINFAQCVNLPVERIEEPVVVDPVAEQIAQENETIRKSEFALRKAQLDLELKMAKQQLEPPKLLTDAEVLEKSAQSFLERNLKGPELAEHLRAQYAEKFKNDPEALKRANLLVDAWVREHLDQF